MPGRQAHGRSLLKAPKKAKGKPAGKASKNRSQKNALNAFGIAQDNFAPADKKTPRYRQLDAELSDGPARGGDGDDDDDDEDMDSDEDEGPRRKKQKAPPRRAEGLDYASDSDGNDVVVGGMAEDDEDSEIESDDAFGDSDNDKFQGYSFKGSKAPQRGDDETEDDSQDEEGETLGAEAIDLATALDQYQSDSEDEGPAPESGSESGSEEDSEEASEDDEESATSEDDEADPDKAAALQKMVSGFGGADDEANSAPQKQKLDLSDLGLSGIDDPSMRNALKLMRKEESSKGQNKKLEIPLSRREQGRNEREAAYKRTNKEADKWQDTIQHNREAEHLVFPLRQNAADVGLDTREIKPLTAQDASHSELGSAVLGIMAESGLSTAKKNNKPKVVEYDEDGNLMTRKQIQNRKRKEREENAREAKRQRRIKKIKSKSYRRVHRNDKQGVEDSDEEMNSEEEREAADRRRALERVGARHKESKWAKLGNKAKRAVWDDDFRAGLSEMARRDEELRRRKDGRAGEEGESDDTSSEGSDSEEDEDARILREIARLEEEGESDGNRKGLEGLKFMRDAEARKRQEEKKLLLDIKRTITGEGDGEDEEGGEVGRQTFGKAGAKEAFKPAIDTSKMQVDDEEEDDTSEDDDDDVEIKTVSGKKGWEMATSRKGAAEDEKEKEEKAEGGWTVGAKRKRKGGNDGRGEELDIDTAVTKAAPAPKPSKKKSSSKAATYEAPIDANSSDSDFDSDAPTTSKSSLAAAKSKSQRSAEKAALLSRAFATDDSLEQAFHQEKQDLEVEEGDKVVDNTLPGWGSWVGEGVSKREKEKHKGRFMKKVEGVKVKDRRDHGLERVIMHEKPVKATQQYYATQLPTGFETRTQYERSLRMPVGQEWQTRETFKKGIQPRVQVKQGVIAPMSKPVI